MYKHCMGGCCHEKTKEVFITEENEFFKTKTFDHYEHYCDKCPEQYAKWWEDNGNKTTEEASDCPCFEPTEIVASLDNLNNLAQSILDRLNETEKQK